MATVWFCEPAEDELKGFDLGDKEWVTYAVSLLEDASYREQNKIDLCTLKTYGRETWGLIVGNVWLAFCEKGAEDIEVIWVSLRSRFRV